MKFIKYNLFQGNDKDGNAMLLPTFIEYSESNMLIAQAEAYNGEYRFVEIEIDEDLEKTALIKNNEELTEENVMLKA
jgi:hypothetical protein